MEDDFCVLNFPQSFGEFIGVFRVLVSFEFLGDGGDVFVVVVFEGFPGLAVLLEEEVESFI